MTIFGYDSAQAPTPLQAKAALNDGVKWWGLYLAGPGAYRNWTPPDVEMLRQAGFASCLPIFVPKLDLSGDPVSDANAMVAACEQVRISGTVALDTEASMRGNPNLGSYVDRFCAQIRARGFAAVVYAGGNYTGNSSNAVWWIEPGNPTPPHNECYQYGQSNFDGLSIDKDAAGDEFPLARLSMAPSPNQPTAAIAAALMLLEDPDMIGSDIQQDRNAFLRLAYFARFGRDWQTPDEMNAHIADLAFNGTDKAIADILDG